MPAQNPLDERISGVLMPLPMLYGPSGIGVMGSQAREFIDIIAESGFSAWQILPVERVGAAYSPYKSLSAFAGEPMLIDPQWLYDKGLLTASELQERYSGVSEHTVDYPQVEAKQEYVLRRAFERLEPADCSKITEYNPFWLEPYALYMSLKEEYGSQWMTWPDLQLRAYEAKAVAEAKQTYARQMEYHRFVQWLFHEQWSELKKYAEKKGIAIIGDIPFYVSEDSAEVWSRRELFSVTQEGKFDAVAGVPPDYFNPLGQRWGNPLYRWEEMEKEHYAWWTARMREAISRYDIIRLDHFRGFESYWEIPADLPDARGGKWVKGPGIKPFTAMEKELGALPVFAEDLGDVGAEVRELLAESGYMGMRVLQFGFLGGKEHLPHNYTEKTVAYTGTHDNTTLLAWMYELHEAQRQEALFYAGIEGDWSRGGPNCLIIKAWARILMMSCAKMVILPIQDLLGYGSDTRTNVPGTSEGNWRVRMTRRAVFEIDRGFYRELNAAYDRLRITEDSQKNGKASGNNGNGG